VSPSGAFLYAVDAGTNDVAAFSIGASGQLTLVGRYPTNGPSPVSITIDSSGRYLYVLNTGSLPSGSNAPGGIAGFAIGAGGALTPIAGSSQALSNAQQYVDPSEIAFSRNGTYLVATEKATSLIDIFPVAGGVAGPAVSTASTGNIPFGFGITPSGTIIVSNAESTTSVTASTLSSYNATAAGALTVISGRVPDDQGAACWVALTSSGNFAYVANTISGSISAYAVNGGALTLLTPGGVTAAQANTTGPIDAVVSPGNASLYVLDSMAGKAPGSIAGFQIAADGSLSPVSTGVTGFRRDRSGSPFAEKPSLACARVSAAKSTSGVVPRVRVP